MFFHVQRCFYLDKFFQNEKPYSSLQFQFNNFEKSQLYLNFFKKITKLVIHLNLEIQIHS